MEDQKQKINISTVKRLWKYIKANNMKTFIIVIVCIIINSLTMILSSIFLKTLIDKYITPLIGTENPVFTGLLQALSIIVVMYVIGITAGYVYNRLMVVIAQKVLKDIRDEMFDKMETLPISYFDTHTHGDVMSYYTNDTDTLMQMITESLPKLISCITSIIGVFFAMIYICLPLTVFVIIFTFLMLFATKTIAGKSAKYFINQQKSIGEVNGYIEEMINGAKVVKVFTHEEKAKEGFTKLNDELCENMFKANSFANVLMPICNSLGNLEYVLVAIIGGILAINFNLGITVGVLASFLSLTKSFNQPINQVASQINSVITALAGATRIFEMLDEKPEEDDGHITLVNVEKIDGKLKETKKETGIWAWKCSNNEYVEVKGHIELKDVTFGYEPDKAVLNDISVYAKPGQKIAFVGATGAGKTTITNLINRFYDIDSGEIIYDGINIKDIKKADLRKSLGMVLQDVNLFTGTIKENIKYGNENATDEEVINAAKLANAHDFITMLPQGYDTMLTANGAELSQGQRQLISIARVAINNPPVMILDEATSSIDTRTEKLVQEGMDKLMDGRTVFVIAHRLSTVRNSKAIIVMSHGEIIERGEHEYLIEQKGQYYQLYTGAFELE